MGGFAGGMHGGMTSGGMRGLAGSPHFAAIGPGPGFSRPGFAAGPRVVGSPRFAGAPFTRTAFGPHFSRFGFHNRFFHHRRFAFFIGGAPYYYDYGYDSCYQRVWTAYGPQWVNVCGGDYGYY
jgi:hypothetical protein